LFFISIDLLIRNGAAPGGAFKGLGQGARARRPMA
jgi:hypothetical protein